MVKAGILALFLISEEKVSFQSFTIENDVCCGIFIYGFYYVAVVESFYHKRVLNFVKSIEMIV